MMEEMERLVKEIISEVASEFGIYTKEEYQETIDNIAKAVNKAGFSKPEKEQPQVAKDLEIELEPSQIVEALNNIAVSNFKIVESQATIVDALLLLQRTLAMKL